MTIPESLNVVTLIMCVVTLTMASLALMPQIKQGLTVLRDSVLWAVLLGIVITVGVIGWIRFVEVQGRPASENTADKLSGDYQDLTREIQSAFSPDRYRAFNRPGDRDALGPGYTSSDHRRNSPRRGVRWQ